MAKLFEKTLIVIYDCISMFQCMLLCIALNLGMHVHGGLEYILGLCVFMCLPVMSNISESLLFVCN